MSAPTSEFLHTLTERGFIHQCSDLAGLDAKARGNEVVGYIGFDCTAPSLHVGFLVQIMMLHWMQKTGQKPDRADGRRHHARRRSLRQGREPQALELRGDRGEQEQHQDDLRPLHDALAAANPTPSWPTTPNGWRRSTTSTSCAMSAGTSRSTACSPSIASSCGSTASMSCRSSNSTTWCCRPTTSSSCSAATAASCRWAAPTNGATSSTASISAAAWARRSSMR